MKQIKNPLLLKVPEVAELLGMRLSKIYDNVRAGLYPPGVVVFLSEKCIRFHRDNLIAWVEAGGAYKPIES